MRLKKTINLLNKLIEKDRRIGLGEPITDLELKNVKDEISLFYKYYKLMFVLYCTCIILNLTFSILILFY